MYIDAKIEEVYEASKKNKDVFILRECVLSKLGEMLAKDRADLKKSLQGRGIKITKDSDNFILTLLLDQLNRSEDYCEEITQMLLKKNGVKKANRMVADISKILKDVSGNEKAKKIIIEYKEQVIYGDDEAKKLYADGGMTDEELAKKLAKKRKIYVGVGILLICACVGYGCYFFKKRKKEQSLLDKEEKENEEQAKGVQSLEDSDNVEDDTKGSDSEDDIDLDNEVE